MICESCSRFVCVSSFGLRVTMRGQNRAGCRLVVCRMVWVCVADDGGGGFFMACRTPERTASRCSPLRFDN